MAKSKTIYTCQKCGAQRSRWEGRCSECSAWNSFVEETFQESTQKGWTSASHSTGNVSKSAKIQNLSETFEVEINARRITGIHEFDRVLGGGLVPGSFTLLGGDPGIGKSTLLMQMSGGLAQNGAQVLYVSAEESLSQTGLRAQRLGIKSPSVHILSESNLDVILETARELKPDILIVDSIQTVFIPKLESAPGTVSQVRECSGHLMIFAKTQNVSTFVIGHVTKDGSLAGPKVLEHMVDTVLAFEGDSTHQFRMVRSLKNRFGAANELGVFQMQSSGLKEVSNPSELFLEERGDKLIGSSVYASMEGSRPLLCEIQALTVSTNMAMPRRTALGIDLNRLHMVIAVLDKNLGLGLYQSDIFLNCVGGIRITEPAADLAVAVAIISSALGKDIPKNSCFFGEIGLTGEIRAVTFAENRLREAQKLGFKKYYVPLSNRKHLVDIPQAILDSVVFVKNVSDLNGLGQRS